MKKPTPLPRLLKKAQEVFNAYIRARDRDKGCISCGAEVQEAGHYFSQGHHSALRFNEVNTNGQCTRCNCFLHGNLIHYRSGLINRYGEPRVFHLESSARRSIKKWSRTELEAIIQFYKEAIKTYL
jgi:NinG protein